MPVRRQYSKKRTMNNRRHISKKRRMTKKRRLSKRRHAGKRRRISKKRGMYGGLNTPPDVSQGSMNLSELNVSNPAEPIPQGEPIPQNNWMNWENPDYSGNTSFESDMSLNNSQTDNSMGSFESNASEPFDTDISMIEPEDDVNEMDVELDESFGGRRKRKIKY